MVAQTRAGGSSSPAKLKFHEKLAGKGLSTDALQKKLKALHVELAALDQEVVDVQSLASVRKELINTSILLHKDRGVKAYAACCLADLLRLYAPDAPYTPNELRDIFEFFIRQLSTGLTGTDAPYYNEYFHLLESLSTVKSVVLVCDLPHADALMADIFRDFFGLVRHELAKKIELFMSDILIALIDECQSLPSDVLEAIMAQFMDKSARMDQPAYRLAVQVCNATADKLQRHVCQYFTDIIVQHSRDEEFEEVRTAHELIKRLNRSCPALLHNVVPQLEEELRVEETQIRLMATQVLGEMFADKGSADFVKKYPTTWNLWLLRKNDKAPAVRLAFVEAAKGVLINLPAPREQIEESLQSKMLDPDEKVRAAVCKLYSQLDYETALHHVSENQLRSVAGRGLDKKQPVRIEAINCIARLYSLAYPEIENGEPAAVKHFSWIPQSILHMAATTPEVKAIAEQVMADYILPLPSLPSSSSKSNDIDEGAWTDRLLLTMKYLDDKAINALLSFSGNKVMRPTLYERYLENCIAYNGGIVDENEESVADQLKITIKHISAQFPDAHKAAEDLLSFAKKNESRLYKLLKTCLDLQTDLKGLVKALGEFVRRLEQSLPTTLSTMSVILRRACLWIVNQSSIPTLVRRVQKGDEFQAGNAKTWLTYISKHCPSLYKSHVGELTKAVADEKNTVLVEACLQSLAAVVKWDKKLAPTDKRTTDRVLRFVMGSNYRHAKFATRLLAHAPHHEEKCAQVVEMIADGLSTASPEVLIAHIAVLAEVVLNVPDAFEGKSDVIMAFLLKRVLMAPAPETQMDTDEDWVEDAQMPLYLRGKILALKVCRNRCLAHSSDEDALDISKPVLKMFATLLQYNGSFSADAEDLPTVKTRMRLQTAISLMRLCTINVYAQALASQFILLALTIQDTCFFVRLLFTNKLVALLTSRQLPSHFNIIPFLSAVDPEPDVKNTCKAYVTFVLRKMPKDIRLSQFEMHLIRLLHLLAHHPDFALEPASLYDIARYITFYLDLVVSADNVALLYHLAMKAKTIRDAESHTYSENLYAVSELAQHLIKARTKQHSWSLQSYPGKIRLPSDILRPLPNPEAANQILKTVYLPEDTLAWLAEQSKPKAETREKPKAPAKRKAAPKASVQTKRSRPNARRRKDDSDSEESSPTDSEDEEDVNPASAVEPNETTSEEENVEPPAEKLSRTARTRAKARIKELAKGKGKTRAIRLSDR